MIHERLLDVVMEGGRRNFLQKLQEHEGKNDASSFCSRSINFSRNLPIPHVRSSRSFSQDPRIRSNVLQKIRPFVKEKRDDFRTQSLQGGKIKGLTGVIQSLFPDACHLLHDPPETKSPRTLFRPGVERSAPRFRRVLRAQDTHAGRETFAGLSEAIRRHIDI